MATKLPLYIDLDVSITAVYGVDPRLSYSDYTIYFTYDQQAVNILGTEQIPFYQVVVNGTVRDVSAILDTTGDFPVLWWSAFEPFTTLSVRLLNI